LFLLPPGSGAPAQNWRCASVQPWRWAATAFSGAVLIAEHIDHYRSRALANDRSIIAEFVDQPICTNTADSVRRIAAVMIPQNERE